jgi:mannitol PTS system EIIA component
MAWFYQMTDLVQPAGILLGVTASSREEAVTLCGDLLEKLGCVSHEYVDAMWEREQIFSSFIGNGVAIPHGTDASRIFVKQTQIVMVRFSQSIDWEGEQVDICFGIASNGDEHGEILANIANLILDESDFDRLMTEQDENLIVELLGKESAE